MAGTMVQIHPGAPEVIEGVSSKSGTAKAYRIVKQAALLVRDDGVTQSFSYQPAKDQAPLPAGNYALGHRPYVQEGVLRLVPVLIPLAAAADASGGTKR